MRTLFAAMKDVVIKDDAEGRYLEIAPTNPENLFRPTDEMLGKTVYEVLPKEQADYVLSRIAESLQTGQIISGEYSLPIDTSEIWFSVNISPLPDNTVIWMAHDITSMKHAADELLESERRFRETLENVNLIAIELDISGNITFCNEFGLQLMGWQWDEIIAKNWFNTCLPARIQKIKSNRPLPLPWHQALFPVHYENELLTRLGEERLVRWSNTVLRDPSGDPVGTSSIGEDITEKRQPKNRSARDPKLELKKAQAYAHVGSWIWDIKTGKLEWSDEMYKIFGIPKERFSGNLQEVVANAIHPDDRQKVEESNSLVTNETGKPIPLEYRILQPDGSQRVVWAEAGELEKDVEGNPALLRGIVMDITERMRAEEAVKAERNFALEIMDSMGQGLTVTDEHGCFEYVNPAYARMTGYEPKDLLGKNPSDFTAPGSKGILEEAGARRRLGETTTYESELEHTDGHTVPVIITGVPHLEAGKASGTIAVITDLTERKRAEEEIHQRNSELSALNSLGRQVSQSIVLDEVISVVVDELLKTAQTDVVFIFLREGDQLNLAGIGPEGVDERFGEIPNHKVGECLCGLAVSEGKPLYSRNLQG